MASSSISREFPGFANLYQVQNPFTGGHYQGRAYDHERGDRIGAFARAERKPPAPVRVEWFMGKASPSDVVWASAVLLLSEKVLRILADRSFSGWTTYQVDLRDKSGAVVDGYVGLAITGRCGPIDESKSLTILKQFPARVSPMRKGYYFEPSTWDGADVFIPSTAGDGRIFVTAPVRDALVEAKVRNLKLISLEEVEYDPPPTSRG